MSQTDVNVDGATLNIEDVRLVARDGASAVLAETAKEKVARARSVVESKAATDDAIYGLNTGFGYLKNVRIAPAELAALQVNLIRSHAAGWGPPLSIDQTRAIMLLRANAMATGRSGVSLATLQRLIDFLNRGVHPVIPSKGSVGASGDLAPLAHLALALIGEGEVWCDDGRSTEPADAALRRKGLEPLRLGPKEGLCLVNGTQAMAGLGCLVLLDAEELMRAADIVGALSLEGRRGTVVAFDPRIQACRGHPGQVASAANLRALLDDSEIRKSHADCDAVQDPYSFRCMPQVHGATRDVLAFVRKTLEIEVNAGTDNPLVFAEAGEGDALLSGGNFHGQPLAFALDFLAIAVSELADISDRRVAQLIDPTFSKLPAFLAPSPGLHSGFMMAQVTGASLVNENRILSSPASTDSIPTSVNQEDHVSMGTTSARKAATVVANVSACLGIELLCACQAIDLLGMRPGRGVFAAHRRTREEVTRLTDDRPLHHDIARAAELVVSGELRRAVEREIGRLS